MKPGRSGFIFVGSAPFGGRSLGLFLVLISTGVQLSVVVTQASCRRRAYFRAAAGSNALETCEETMEALTHDSLLAQQT